MSQLVQPLDNIYTMKVKIAKRFFKLCPKLMAFIIRKKFED